MKRILFSIIAVLFLVVAIMPMSAHSGGRGGYGGGYRHGGGHGSFWGPAIVGGLIGGFIGGAFSQPYYYAPQPRYYAPAQPMCYRNVQTGYWVEDYYGGQRWIPTGSYRQYFPCY